MKQLHYITKNFIVFFTLMFVQQACVKDEIPDCSPNAIDYRIYFKYLNATKVDNIVEGIRTENVTLLNAFIFDKDGKYVKTVLDERPVMSKDYYIEIPDLLEDEYKIIVWGGYNEDCYALSNELIVGETSYTDLQLKLNCIQNDTVSVGITHLFYARNSEVILDDPEFNRDTIELIQNTYTMNITVSGIEDLSDQYFLTVYDNNGNYYFDNTLASCSNFYYKSNFTKSNSQLKTSLTVLRLAKNRAPKLRIINSTQNTSLLNYEINLVEMILALREATEKEIDFSYMHEFDIEFVYNPYTEVGFDIYINDWKINFEGIILYT